MSNETELNDNVIIKIICGDMCDDSISEANFAPVTAHSEQNSDHCVRPMIEDATSEGSSYLSTKSKVKENNNLEYIELRYGIAKHFKTIFDMINDLGRDDSNAIPLPNVSKSTFLKCKEYLDYLEKNSEELKDTLEENNNSKISSVSKISQTYIEKMDKQTLIEVILAANYLCCDKLLQAASWGFANLIRGKTPEEICKTFNIKPMFSEQEMALIRRENEWCESE